MATEKQVAYAQAIIDEAIAKREASGTERSLAVAERLKKIDVAAAAVTIIEGAFLLKDFSTDRWEKGKDIPLTLDEIREMDPALRQKKMKKAGLVGAAPLSLAKMIRDFYELLY